MYNRSYRQRRPPTVPLNYSGSAFLRDDPEKGNYDLMPIPPSPSESLEKSFLEQGVSGECRSPSSNEGREGKKGELLSGLFGGKLFPRGIGNEELLLLALILLVAQSADADELLIYLVVLLLT